MPRPAIRLNIDGPAAAGEFGDPLKTRSSVTTPQRLWPVWTMLVVFAFIGFECLLLGAALKGPWLILMAPGLVCAYKAFETWRELTRRMNHREQNGRG